MATGDNGLTAISVGRHCKIIDEKKTAYLAERVKDPEGKNVIKWIKIDVVRVDLDSSKLHHHHHHGSHFDRKKSLVKMSNIHRLSHLSGFDENVPEYEASKGTKNQMDELAEIDEECPWEGKYDDSELQNYEVAISGKAFQQMISDIENPQEDALKIAFYKKLILYAKVYARMSPDHKAMLVNEIQKHSPHMVAM
mmetsp:Transcript_23928/g.27546  ORF Transcript_23928/g.27546 Transcript_23928/m.27546 type:complete len:195 (-) Transcript_23928:871-1455(-)